jgi:hypothetical protein
MFTGLCSILVKGLLTLFCEQEKFSLTAPVIYSVRLFKFFGGGVIGVSDFVFR